jgi:hypothetical protein
MAGTHTHGNAPPHEHADDAPGHVHDERGNVTGGAGTTGAPTTTGTAGTPGGAGFASTAAPAEHRHAGIGSHAHADARPGHSHDEERTVRERPGGGLAGRVIFGLVGVAGMLVGPFLTWVNGERGTAVEIRAFFSTEAGSDAGFVASAGFVVLVLGAVALLGLLFRSGWLTSLAAGLGLAATILVGISALRGDEGVAGIGLGLWIAAVGSLLALIASMFATRTKVVETRQPRTF